MVTEKNFENNNVIIKIEEQTSTKSGLIFQISINFKWKDSTKIEHKYFKDKDVSKVRKRIEFFKKIIMPSNN